MPPHPDSKPAIDLGTATLAPIGPGDASRLGAMLAAIDPWARMTYPAEALARYLAEPDPAARKYAIWRGAALAGCLAVREPWLKGPYLELLGLAPAFQGRGIGSAVLAWFERQAGSGARNLWVVTSAFNTRALAFYRRHGFVDAATLPELVCDGFDEILLRKRLAGAPGRNE